MILQKIIHRFRTVRKDYRLSRLNKLAFKNGYSLIPLSTFNASTILIENHFKTKHPKNALLSYMVYPFIGEIEYNHSNYRECYLMAEILNELGYNVDVINWDNNTFIPSKMYHLVIDNHNNLERLNLSFEKDCLKIFHATNAHWLFQNKIEFDRHYEYFISTGIALNPSRILPQGNSMAFCDAISMLGNDFTKNTFGGYANSVHRIPISVTTQPELVRREKINDIKYNFLWFNSTGFLLKGLDIVLDTFIGMPECRLFICGNFDRESDFINSYANRLKDCSNIKLIGWVDITSNDFKKLVENCTWVINTSFSEGGGGSTVNCMAKGLIPIVTKSASIDIIDGETGFMLEDNSSNALGSKIKQLVQLPLEQITTVSENVFRYIYEHHTFDIFKAAYKAFLKGLIKNDAAA
jgi:glycosyltransferase involved in cell wall biosynthesis